MEKNNTIIKDTDLYLVDIPEACRRLNICKDKIYEHIGRNELKTVKNGARRQISNRAINEFISEREG
jgi:excisionase family DNA binding protein